MDLRRRSALIGAAAAGLAGPSATPVRADGPGASVLRFVPAFDLRGMDPIVDTGLVTLQHAYLVYDTLFAMDGAFQPRPQMIGAYEACPDGLTHAFRLRPGLRFHDGTAVEAEDCIASIRRWGARDVVGKLILARTASLDAIDETAFRLRLIEPFPLLLHALAKISSSPCFIMRRRDAATDPSVAVKGAIGSGPFRFLPDAFVPGARVVYAANTDYVPRSDASNGYAGGKRAGVGRIEWHVIADPATQVNALQAGEVDIVASPALDSLPRLRADPAVTVRLFDRLGWTAYIRPNQLFPPFSDIRARQALTYLAAQSDYMQAAAGDPGNWAECRSFLSCAPPPSGSGGDALGTPDLSLARELLAASGYAGETIVVLDPVDSPILSNLAAVTISQLRKIGASVRPYAADTATVFGKRASTQPPDQGGWHLFHTISLGLELESPLTSFPLASPCRSEASGPPPGWYGWPCDAAIETLRQDWARAPGEADRRGIAALLERAAARSLPFIPVGRVYTPVAYRNAVQGLPEMPVPVLWNASVSG
jgi:peptide/nickel transport system substrate-binding protein